MVLQNKYKARASKRYNAARGGLQDSRGRGGGGGGRGRGRGGYRGNNEDSFPSLNADDDYDDGEEGGEGEDDDDDQEGTDSGQEIKGKYSRRKMESNAWRYHEEEVDPNQEEEEPEPEVDLSGLLERVAKLDSSRTSRALSSKEAAETSLKAENEDIDHSLLYLLDRQRERERGRGIAVDGTSSTKSSGAAHLSASELKLLEMEGKRLLEERERERRHYGRAQKLKYQPQSKVISLNIGENQRKNKDDNQSKTQIVNRPQPKMNMAALYDEIDEAQASSGENDLDCFLNNLDKVKDIHQTNGPSPSAPKSNNTNRLPASDTTTTSSKHRKDDEDFLDSII